MKTDYSAMLMHLKILNFVRLAHSETWPNFYRPFWTQLMSLCLDSYRPIKYLHCRPGIIKKRQTLLRAIKSISNWATQFLCCETGKTKRQPFLICSLFNMFIAWVAGLMSSLWATSLQEYNRNPFQPEPSRQMQHDNCVISKIFSLYGNPTAFIYAINVH